MTSSTVVVAEVVEIDGWLMMASTVAGLLEIDMDGCEMTVVTPTVIVVDVDGWLLIVVTDVVVPPEVDG